MFFGRNDNPLSEGAGIRVPSGDTGHILALWETEDGRFYAATRLTYGAYANYPCDQLELVACVG